jgi:hypothetical protein
MSFRASVVHEILSLLSELALRSAITLLSTYPLAQSNAGDDEMQGTSIP